MGISCRAGQEEVDIELEDAKVLQRKPTEFWKHFHPRKRNVF